MESRADAYCSLLHLQRAGAEVAEGEVRVKRPMEEARKEERGRARTAKGQTRAEEAVSHDTSSSCSFDLVPKVVIKQVKVMAVDIC